MNTGRAEGILENLKQERLNLTRRLRAVQEEIDEEDCRANRGREVVVQKVREPGKHMWEHGGGVIEGESDVAGEDSAF